MRLATGVPMSLSLSVVNGRWSGPTVWLSGAIHGDEVNGVEIVRTVAGRLDARQTAGTVIAVPVVNVLGFLAGDRYLPDRRDLNRSFPGSQRGSLAARIAHLFMTNVVDRCSAGIDFHTGTNHRSNLPQIRANLGDPETRRLAEAFAPEVLVQASLRDGSLRQAATERGVTTLLYEGGQPNRFDPSAVAAGVDGTLRVLAALGMITGPPPAPAGTVEVSRTTWVRARRSGLARMHVRLGDRVTAGDTIAEIGDVLGGRPTIARAPADAIVIGASTDPLVNRGDALANLGLLEPPLPNTGSA